MSIQIKDKIISIIRADFDQTPKNWGGDGWYDNAEEVADSIVALFASPQTDLVSRAEVLRVIRSLGAQDADLAMYGAADNARAREYGEAAATRACCAIALMPPASPSPAPAAVDWRDDPTSDERWNAGCDFAMTQLCRFLGVDPATVDWDAATETLDGDVQSVIGKILRAKLGEDWGPSEPAPAAVEALVARLDDLAHELTPSVTPGNQPRRLKDALREAATALSTLAADKARSEAERDEALAKADLASRRIVDVLCPTIIRLGEHLKAAEARASALEGEVERLRAAVTPFAWPPLYVFDSETAFVPTRMPEDWIGGGYFTTHDFQRARAALAPAKETTA